MEIHKTKKPNQNKTQKPTLFWPSIDKAEKKIKKSNNPNKQAWEHY